MNFISCTENKVFPYLIVDNFYNEKEQMLIWDELDYHILNNSFEYDKGDKDDGRKGVATADDGKPLANLTRIYLDDIYFDRRQSSNILNFYLKIVSKKVVRKYSQTTPSWVTFKNSNNDCSQVSYFENKSDYKNHTDDFMHTCLIWFYREPKRFTGGDLQFPQSNKVVECKHNRMILFPSYYEHEVSEVVMKEEDVGMGLGRFTLSHFYNCSDVQQMPDGDKNTEVDYFPCELNQL